MQGVVLSAAPTTAAPVPLAPPSEKPALPLPPLPPPLSLLPLALRPSRVPPLLGSVVAGPSALVPPVPPVPAPLSFATNDEPRLGAHVPLGRVVRAAEQAKPGSLHAWSQQKPLAQN